MIRRLIIAFLVVALPASSFAATQTKSTVHPEWPAQWPNIRTNIQLISNDINTIFGYISDLYAKVAVAVLQPDGTTTVTNGVISASLVNPDWNATAGFAKILNKPSIPAAQINADWNAVSGLSAISNKPTLFSGSYADITGKPSFALVATSGSYADLSGKPTIPSAQVNSDWNAGSGSAVILNKPTLFSGAYGDLSGKPTFAAIASSGAYSDLSGKPALATVATSGAYADLTGKPSIPAAQVNSDWSASSGAAQILNKPALAAVATSGAYADLTGRPTIPASQVNSDWNAASGLAQILNKPTVPTSLDQLTDGLTNRAYSTAEKTKLAGIATNATANSSDAYLLSRANQTGTQLSATISDFTTAAAAAAPVQSVAGRTGTVTLSSSDVGLGNVNNTADLAKPVSTATQTALNAKFATPAGTTSQYLRGDGSLATFPSIPVVQAYDGTTQKLGTFTINKSATVASGTAVFNLTADGTSTGTALFPNGPILNSVNLSANDATAAYQYGWVWSNSNKTLTVTVNKSSATLFSALGINVLSAPAAANGATVLLQVRGN